MSQENIKNIQIKYKSIKVLKFAQFEVGDFILTGTNDLEYLNEFQVAVNDKTEDFIITSTLRIKILSTDEIFCELTVASGFKIHPFSALKIDKEEGNISFPENLIRAVSDVAMSTMRGILHEKLKGTILQDEVLPLIQIKDILKH